MELKLSREIKSKGEAQQIAIDWQNWQSKKSLSYGEFGEWIFFFEALARKFHLVREFRENGII